MRLRKAQPVPLARIRVRAAQELYKIGAEGINGAMRGLRINRAEYRTGRDSRIKGPGQFTAAPPPANGVIKRNLIGMLRVAYHSTTPAARSRATPIFAGLVSSASRRSPCFCVFRRERAKFPPLTTSRLTQILMIFVKFTNNKKSRCANRHELLGAPLRDEYGSKIQPGVVIDHGSNNSLPAMALCSWQGIRSRCEASAFAASSRHLVGSRWPALSRHQLDRANTRRLYLARDARRADPFRRCFLRHLQHAQYP